MKRSTLLKIHLIATGIAVATILTFFISSLVAEIRGDESFIKSVKAFIIYALPLMIVSMPTLAITGKKLAGQSKNRLVLVKKGRMKWIMVNGMILISLAVFLYYRSHFQVIDRIFLGAQLGEFLFGITNLTLIILNARTGKQLSGKLAKSS
jgi:membrane protein CcdC involved in cytochrome C biogenesis